MKNIIFLLLSFAFFQSAIAQGSKVYEFVPEHTKRKVKQYKESPSVYTVMEKKFKFVAAAPKRKIPNKRYELLETEISSLVADSIAHDNTFQNKLAKYREVVEIKKLVESFLNSTRPYEMKKTKLVEAQKLALQHNIDELIYADAQINSQFKSKFFVLQLNKIDLKVHLKKISWRLDQMELVKPVKKPSSILNQRLQELREQKRGLKKYNYIVGKSKVTYKNGYAAVNQIKGIDILNGKFKKTGTYYMLKSDYKQLFAKNQLIDAATEKEHNLKARGYATERQTMFVNLDNGKTFVANGGFLTRFAFSINGKFNTKSQDTYVYN